LGGRAVARGPGWVSASGVNGCRRGGIGSVERSAPGERVLSG
jgi:hypothetical protein